MGGKGNKGAGGLRARLLLCKIKTIFHGNLLLSFFLWLVVAFFIVYPLFFLLLESFKIAGTDRLGFQNYIDFFKDPYYLKTFGNTLLLGFLVLMTTSIVGLPLAYILARYRLRGRTLFTALILLPIVLPAYAGAFAFIVFFGKWGTINSFSSIGELSRNR